MSWRVQTTWQIKAAAPEMQKQSSTTDLAKVVIALRSFARRRSDLFS
jgi:hypothetical protein